MSEERKKKIDLYGGASIPTFGEVKLMYNAHCISGSAQHRAGNVMFPYSCPALKRKFYSITMYFRDVEVKLSFMVLRCILLLLLVL